jgi:hypothetical protein
MNRRNAARLVQRVPMMMVSSFTTTPERETLPIRLY